MVNPIIGFEFEQPDSDTEALDMVINMIYKEIKKGDGDVSKITALSETVKNLAIAKAALSRK